jgi:hypothetical protein
VTSAEVATEKAKRVIEELKETTLGSTEETKESE